MAIASMVFSSSEHVYPQSAFNKPRILVKVCTWIMSQCQSDTVLVSYLLVNQTLRLAAWLVSENCRRQKT